MEKVKQFKTVDLVVFSVIALVSDYLSVSLLNVFSGAGLVFSFALLISLIAIYRWGWIGSIVYVVAGIGSVLVTPSIASVLYYPIANGAIIGTVLLFRVVSKEKIKKNALFMFLYTIVPILFLSLSKGLVILLFDKNLYGFTDYFASQLLTIVITFIVLNIVVRVEGLLEDMSTYIQE